ncbi:MAG TPA: AAA family ATPase [Streptosporangiaceae bacterium]|nr:AAA family ATPase [Streptosporangiaceae bacterium]
MVVGRDSEFSALTALVDASRAGAGGWVTVSGEAGVGKSRLVAEVADFAGSAGVAVHAGRCSAADTLTPYRPIAEALLSAAGETGPPATAALRAFRPAVARFVPHWRTGDEVVLSESPAVIGESVIRVLSWLTGGRGLLLVLEDMHWADAETLAVCDYLADHAAGTAIGVVATARTGEGPGQLAELIGRTGSIVLRPLSQEQVAEMAVACLDALPSASVMSLLDRAASGLPLLVEDLLEYGQGGSERFDRLVRQRLEGLPAASRRVVVAAAMLGEDVDAAQLAVVCGASGAEVSEAIAAALGAQLLIQGAPGAVAFRHALTRDAVLACSAADRAAVAARAAAVIDEAGSPDAATRAAELWAEAGDRRRAALAWQRAAVAADAAGALATALRSWRNAVAAAPSRGPRLEMELGLLAHLSASGPLDEAIDLGGRLLDDVAHRPDLEREVRKQLARSCLAAGRPDEAADQLAQLPAGSAGAAPGADQLVLAARLALQRGGGERRLEAEHLAHQAVAEAGQADQPELVCEALDIVARCARSRRLEDASAALRRALAVADSRGLAGWRLRALNELGTVEMLAAADGTAWSAPWTRP